MTSDYKIFVADLAAYNSGNLFGHWIDVMADDAKDKINKMLQQCPTEDAEKWFIFSYFGFGSLDMNKCQSIKNVREIAEFLDEYPDIGEVLLHHFEMNLESVKIAVDQYQGNYDDLSEYFEIAVDDADGLSEYYQPYIDYKKMAQDMEREGEIFCIRSQGHIYVFLPFDPV
jgi:antirestriction protein